MIWKSKDFFPDIKGADCLELYAGFISMETGVSKNYGKQVWLTCVVKWMKSVRNQHLI